MGWIIYTVYLSLLLSLSRGLSNNSSKDALKATKLPPCASCRVFTESFKQGMVRTSRGKFEGGDAAWEEEKMKTYKNSEVRLVEIQEKLCSEVERGQVQCQAHSEDYETLLENWWFDHQDSQPSLHDWLCIEHLNVCCPPNHYGAQCLPCKGGIEKPCGGNGRCKGGGTRKGNGECDCDAGYEGEFCGTCAPGQYEAYRDENKVMCQPCHRACQGHCTQAGPKSCMNCNTGWRMDTDHGCLDVNECIATKTPCKVNDFCINNEGSYTCVKCHKACDGCSGDGPDMCHKCATGFVMEDDACVDKSGREREEHMAFARYVTYAGLTIATCIILQRHTVMAAIVGLFVAVYISLSEYYLTHMQKEGNKGGSQVPFDLGSGPESLF